jgi:hypothetical protein
MSNNSNNNNNNDEEILEENEVFIIKWNEESSNASNDDDDNNNNNDEFDWDNVKIDDDIEFIRLIDRERMLEGVVCDRLSVVALWQQKSRLDRVFDEKVQFLYYKARDSTFPQDKHGSERHLLNRAGDKLLEVHESILKLQKKTTIKNNDDDDDNENDDENENENSNGGIFSAYQSSENDVWFDICGGPGAWSQSALKLTKLPGFGMVNI